MRRAINTAFLFFVSLSGLLLCLFSCTDALRSEFASHISLLENSDGVSYDKSIQLNRNCRDVASYIPDTTQLPLTPIKYIRVNFHVMRRADGSGNFDEEDGVKEILKTLHNANHMLANNRKMKLPVGNDTPVLPIRYRYVLSPRAEDPNDDGIYFHNDEVLYYMIAKGPQRNNFDRKVYDRYGIQKDTVLNVFVMAYHADSLQSARYAPRVRGIGFGKWAKVTTWYHQAFPESQAGKKATFSKYDLNYAHTNLNHEIGHVIGLRHAWVNDGCDDTPSHPNCWGKGAPPCEEISNNIMDYNAAPGAWSPCQIGTAHYRMSQKTGNIRDLLLPSWCTLKADHTVVIKDTVVWRGAKDLEGHLILEENASLTIQCRVSIPPKGKIVVGAGAQLILDGAILENDCGEDWEGIEILERDKKKGKVFYLKQPTIANLKHKFTIGPSPGE